MNSNGTHCAIFLLLASLSLSEAAFECQVSLNLSEWPSVAGLAPVMAKVQVGACAKGSSKATACDIESTSDSVIWYSMMIISYETARNGPEFLDFKFSNSTGFSTSYVFASRATIFMRATAPPFFQTYTFQSGGNLGLTVTNATSQVTVDGEEGTQNIYFRTLFKCEDECTAACQNEYDFPGRSCLSLGKIIGGEVSSERCMADRDACYEECASSRG